MSRRWLITGASRGLGRALAESALAAGDRVMATARDPGALGDLARRHGEAVRLAALDVTDEAAAGRAVALAQAGFGGLDVVVNNAGYGDVGSVEDTALADFRRQIEANLFGAIIVTKAAIPLLREQGSGRFIQISSVGGRIGAPVILSIRSQTLARPCDTGHFRSAVAYGFFLIKASALSPTVGVAL